jgi:hypothetical protein
MQQALRSIDLYLMAASLGVRRRNVNRILAARVLRISRRNMCCATNVVNQK